MLEINRSLVLPPNQYVRDVTNKNLIVLHFTAGYDAQGAYRHWLTTPERIATQYIVDRDGIIYEIFDPKYWAWHLGIKSTRLHDQRSIGIEIVNIGPLTRSGNDLLAWTRRKWCSISERDKYVKSTYRGFNYYASYTRPQMHSISELIILLSHQFNIPLTIPDNSKINEFDPQYFSKFTGIVSHQNFRSDKFDVGPAFNWDQLRAHL